MKTMIRDLRENHDLTQMQLSRMLNASQVTYSYYESGKRGIPNEILMQLADYYNTSIDYILYRTNNKNSYKETVNN